MAKNKKIVPLYLIVITILACLLLFFMEYTSQSDDRRTNEMVLQPVNQRFTYDPESQVTFRLFSKGFIRCTKDGVTAFSFKGEHLWNQTFSMDQPYMVYEGDITAVTEKDGRMVYVYNADGALYSVAFDNPLHYIAVNRTGYLAARYKVENVYKLNVYNANKQIVMERDSADEGVYPTAIDVSDNGNLVAIAYIDTSGVSILTKFVLHTTKNYDNENVLHSGRQRDNEIISIIKFLSNNRLLALSDKSIYLMDETGAEVAVIDYVNEIDAIAFEKDYFVVAMGKKLHSEESYEPGAVLWYNLDGAVVAEYMHSRTVTGLSCHDKYTVLSDGKMYYCLNRTGGIVWRQPFVVDMLDIIPYDRSNAHMALVVTRSEAEVMRLGKKKPDQADSEKDADTVEEEVIEDVVMDYLDDDNADQVDTQDSEIE